MAYDEGLLETFMDDADNALFGVVTTQFWNDVRANQAKVDECLDAVRRRTPGRRFLS